MTESQWLFTIDSLDFTPSPCSREKEFYDRARGVEFLFRLGASLGLPTSAMCTAATWFHRFFMRCSMQDFHRQYVAASCIFLATKTEECGRKLRDVAKVAHAKAENIDIVTIPTDSLDVEVWQSAILLIEELLLEALCFDFVVGSPHAELLDLFESLQTEPEVEEFAWSLAHDSYRTPLCVLYTPRLVAIGCILLAQRVFDGPTSPSLDARISVPSPSKSLPTPPSNKPPSPDATRAVVEHCNLQDSEVDQVAEVLSIFIEFYSAQDPDLYPYLSSISAVQPPTCRLKRKLLFLPVSQLRSAPGIESQASVQELPGRTPSSSQGGRTPIIHTSEEKTELRLSESQQ